MHPHESCGCEGLAGSGSRVVPFLNQRRYDFASLDPTRTVTIVLAPALCVLDAYRVRLAVRVHSLSLVSGQSIQMSAHGTMPSEDDPGRDFLSPTAFLTLNLTSATQSSLMSVSATDPDAYLRIFLSATQNSIASPMAAVLSASLVLRRF